MIAVVLELGGVPSLVSPSASICRSPLQPRYSSAVPCAAGGLAAQQGRPGRTKSAEELRRKATAAGECSLPGYIAGGAIAGIVIAFVQGALGIWMRK
jgi:hypothetical protein